MEFILGSPAEGQAPDAAQPKSGGMEFLLGSPAASSPVPAKVPEAGSRPIRAPVQRLPQEAPELSLEETVKGAASQLVPSTVKMGRDIYQAVTSPVETGKAIGQLGSGVYSKLEGFFANQDPQQKKQNETLLDAVVADYVNKYGSMKEFKRALAEDPASILSDISLAITGGTTAAAKATGLAGKTANT